MILLKATTETLKITTSSTANIDYSVSWVDVTTTTFAPSTSEGKITSATTTTLLAAPAASTQRQVKLITITNIHATASNVVTILKDISGTTFQLTPATTLLAGSSLMFLDGDGWTYKKASVNPAGSDTQIQYNDSGVLAADPDFTWNSTDKTLSLNGVNSEILIKGITTDPSPPSAGNLTIYSKSVAGRMAPKIVGPSGLDTPLQLDVKQNSVAGILSDATYWGVAGTVTGTAAAVLPTTTNLYTAMRRTTYANVVTTANQQVGQRGSFVSRQYGFFFACRFGFDSIKTGMRGFIGVSASASATVTVNPSTVTNLIGFGFDLADSELYFMHNNGTNLAIKETISGQGTLATNNVGYDAYIFCAPNDTKVYYRLDRVDTTVTTLCDTFTSDPLPAASLIMQSVCAMSNGTANIAVNDARIGISKLMVESDR